MQWKVEIEKANNGFIVKYVDSNEESDEQKYVIEELVDQDDIEFFKTDRPQKVALGRLLYDIAEFFGEMRQKYDKDNMSITFDEKGRGVE